MKTATEGLQDLIEEARLRTVWWILCIFVVTYFLTHTSKSMLMNIPVALLMVSGLRILLNEVEFRWKVWDKRSTSYLSYLEKKQLTVNDSRLTTLAPPQKWKRKIGSPVVEAVIEDFISKVLNDFVIDLWYSDITSDKEAPELIHSVVMDILGEVSGRIKEVNLVELLTRDVVDLVGDHLDLFRRNQKAIGVQVMDTLSSEERDERLKHHLLASKELHPALISPECEYKVLQRLMGGLLAVVLRPREAQCPLVRCIARELLTSLVMQPIMDFASPGYINELVIHILLACNSEGFNDVATDQSSSKQHGQSSDSNLKGSISSNNPGTDLFPSGNLSSSTQQDEARHPQSAEWSKVLEAATQRRTEVLMPENLENMWAIGRNYKKDLQKKPTPRRTASEITDVVNFSLPGKDLVTEALKQETSIGTEDKALIQLPPRPQQDTQPTDYSIDVLGRSEGHYGKVIIKEGSSIDELESTRTLVSHETKPKLKRSNSTSDLRVKSNLEDTFSSKGTAPIINEYYSANASTLNAHRLKSNSDVVLRSEGLRPPKLRCRVIGAYFEKLGSKSFAVYSIAVTDADNNTRFVKRRYRNFERLHRHLKDIPNYTLHLPPKRIFSSNTEDTFVHQRCIQLDKYLQDLLSIANVAEQHEVWDFLSASSKNYMFGKSSSAMTTLAVNVDEAVDDIVRQFKEVSDGIVKAVVGPSSGYEQASLVTSRNNLSWHEDDITRLPMRQCTSDSINSFSDIEETVKDVTHEQEEVVSAPQSSECHSDNEMDPKGTRVKSQSESNLAQKYVPQEDQIGMPPEWTPPNLSVPVLNLVDNVFQLNRRGWLRRQVFWISKQILQLVMEDAIDDWLVGQIQWLRREDIIAQGIRWVQDILWPGGIFFTKLRIQNQLNNSQDDISQQTTKQSSGRKATQPGSFEQQLEAARIANDVKNLLFNGAPSTLVSLIGHKQYKRCARDIYYFLQSTICLKQLGYGILELVLISIFPELRDLVKDVHEKMHAQQQQQPI